MKNTKYKLDKLFPESPELYKLKKTYLNVFGYIHQQDWMGACHASTAILYILLKEQGYEVEACIGEVSKLPIIFDHSWIEYEGKVIDASISNTLIKGLKFPPVFLSIDLVSESKTDFEYGCNSSGGIDPTAGAISKMTIGMYMDDFPDHPQGLWGIAKRLAKIQSLRFNVAKVKNKYGESNWVIKS